MSKTVLVIDSNSAVLAITSLALSQTQLTVETLADGKGATRRIHELRPSVVLCAKEIKGVDPFELCRTTKAELKDCIFIMLAPADAVETTATKAKEYLYDEVLFKPFKSNRLREVVTGLLERMSAAGPQTEAVFLAVRDSLRSKIIQRLLNKHGTPTVSTENSAEQALPEHFAALIIEPGAELPAWWSNSQTAHIFGVGVDSALKSRFPMIQELSLPLRAETLNAQLGRLFRQAVELPAAESQAAEDYAAYAAHISAAIFQRLLTSEALRAKNWDQTADVVRDATLDCVRHLPRS
jgi:CheY-like chemotaxis protein